MEPGLHGRNPLLVDTEKALRLRELRLHGMQLASQRVRFEGSSLHQLNRLVSLNLQEMLSLLGDVLSCGPQINTQNLQRLPDGFRQGPGIMSHQAQRGRVLGG
ncbi:hypothetical protein WJ84_00615 [Burkholderia ubonensis]|nr:hypothetical protein WJ84_00615 [Burkholderia ubonensis]